MQLPIIDPMFIETSDAHEHEVFHSYSKGICPRCRELVDGVRILRAGKVYLRKQCLETAAPKRSFQATRIGS